MSKISKIKKMGFLEQVKEFFVTCVKGVYKFLTKTIEVVWGGITFPIKLIYNGASLAIKFIIDGVLKAFDFIMETIEELQKEGIKGNWQKLKEEIGKLKEVNAELESFTYKIKIQDAKTILN